MKLPGKLKKYLTSNQEVNGSKCLVTSRVERGHKCKKCDKGFFIKSDLTKHKKVHDQVNWSCSMCPYEIHDERNLVTCALSA